MALVYDKYRPIAGFCINLDVRRTVPVLKPVQIPERQVPLVLIVMVFELGFIGNCCPYVLPVLAGPGSVLLLRAAGPVLGSGAG